MKLKSLLYGSAAALVAATGAQAADMPIAEPVEYVRVCDAFGTGFFYIPGTDTCLKIGGYVRVEVYAGDRPHPDNEKGDEEDPSITLSYGIQVADSGISATSESVFTGYEGSNNSKDNFTTFARGALSMDARRMTDVGLLRIAFQYLVNVDQEFDASENNADSANLDFAFIQLSNDLGTMTVGHTGSFFNYKGSGTMEGLGANDANTTLLGYSFNVGNGISFSLALEDSNSGGRNGGIEFDRSLPNEDFDASCDNHKSMLELGEIWQDNDRTAEICFADHDGDQVPDITGNIRLDQAWGSIQVMGALHQVRANAAVANLTLTADLTGTIDAVEVDSAAAYHDDDWGWAVGAGGEITAGAISAFIQGFWGEGVGNYFWSPTSGAPVPEGVMMDGGSLELSNVWLVNGAVTAQLGGSLTAVLAAAYGEYDGPGAAGATPDHDEVTVGGDLVWTVTSGYTIGIGAVWWDNSEFGDGAKGRARFQASF